MHSLPAVAVVVGDPYGENINAVLDAIVDEQVKRICRPVIAGDFERITAAARARSVRVNFIRVELEPGKPSRDSVAVVDKQKHPLAPARTDRVARAGERIILDLESALQLTMMGKTSCMAIAPIDMSLVQRAGFHYTSVGALFHEWIRVDDELHITPAQRHPGVGVLTGVPVLVALASLEGGGSTASLSEIVKETIKVAVALVRAGAER